MSQAKQVLVKTKECKNSVVFGPQPEKHAVVDGTQTKVDIVTGIYISNAVLERLGNPTAIELTVTAP